MRNLTRLVAITVILSFFFGASVGVITSARSSQAEPVEEVCQYPGRYYEDGSCNNTDPPCPETIKDPVLKGECPIEKVEPVTAEPIQEVTTVKEVCK